MATISGGIVTAAEEYGIGGDVWLNKYWGDATGDIWNEGGAGYFTLLHEIAHALGLKHPFDPSTSQGVTLAENDHLNTKSHSVMSYTDASDLNVPGYNLPLQPSTLMPFDIEALQYLYGHKITATGNDTYSWSNAPQILQTIWDAGGIDTIDASKQTQSIIDLNGGEFSSIGIRTAATQGDYTGKDNLAIAKGVVIENAKGGNGNDTLIANSANNRLEGGLGNDTYRGFSILNGFGSNDTIKDAGGNDRIELDGTKVDLANVKITHSGGNLVLSLVVGSSVTIADFYTGNSAGSGAIETLLGTNWEIGLVGVANSLIDGASTTLGDILGA